MTSKHSAENKDPTLLSVVKEANDSLIKHLNEITAGCGKLITGLEEYIKFLSQPTEIVVRGVPVHSGDQEISVAYLENRSRSYMQFLTQIKVSKESKIQ